MLVFILSCQNPLRRHENLLLLYLSPNLIIKMQENRLESNKTCNFKECLIIMENFNHHKLFNLFIIKLDCKFVNSSMLLSNS